MEREIIQRQSVLNELEESFAFLKAVSARRKIVSDSNQTRTTFVLPRFFVEIEIDWREQAIFTLVGKLDAGTIPDGYYVSSLGKPCRWHLVQVLNHGGRLMDVEALRESASQLGAGAMSNQIAASSSALRHALNDLPEMLDRVSTAGN